MLSICDWNLIRLTDSIAYVAIPNVERFQYRSTRFGVKFRFGLNKNTQDTYFIYSFRRYGILAILDWLLCHWIEFSIWWTITQNGQPQPTQWIVMSHVYDMFRLYSRYCYYRKWYAWSHTRILVQFDAFLSSWRWKHIRGLIWSGYTLPKSIRCKRIYRKMKPWCSVHRIGFTIHTFQKKINQNYIYIYLYIWIRWMRTRANYLLQVHLLRHRHTMWMLELRSPSFGTRSSCAKQICFQCQI